MSKYFLGLGLLYLANSQSTCKYYTWSSSDWPNSETQDFESLIDFTSKGTRKSNCYIDKSDISEGGEYEGYTWQEATYANVNANKCPDGIRPLGYKKAELGYDNDPAICITANGADNYAVDLMVYTLTPEASVCLSDMDTDLYATQSNSIFGDGPVCGKQRVYYCFSAMNDRSDNAIRVAITCNENCEDGSNVDILYRFRRSQLQFDVTRSESSNNPQMWCNMISDIKDWPDDINDALPDNYTPFVSNSYKYNILYTIIIIFISIFIVF